MAAKHHFGNDPAKIKKYQAFWERKTVRRPLVGLTMVGWFPLTYFSSPKSWEVGNYVTVEMIRPKEWLDDQERLLMEGEQMEDDILRGVCPTQVAFPCFLTSILGCKTYVLPDTVLPEERKLSWYEALLVRFDRQNVWYRCYLDFLEALNRQSRGRYPVSHGAELGPVDLQAVLRGHTQSLLDIIEEPEKSAQLIHKLGVIFRDFFKDVWQQIPLYSNGYFDAQYQLWAPGPIIRMQEDATASFSPALYRQLVQPVDRMIARAFTYSFIHLHSTSMFLLDSFLEIEEIRCFEINVETFNISVRDMIQYFHKVQEAERALLVLSLIHI